MAPCLLAIPLQLLTSVVVQGRIAPLAGRRWGRRSVVVVWILLLLLLLVELVVCKLLVLIVHVTPVPVVTVPLLPGDEVNGQAVRPDILHFTDRFRRGRYLK